ncbi:MAG: 2,3-bisphosphoglycerate-independent phosphoglycerate mutase [Candidatus Pacebacteria bacterium]|nr:2,3-bisphosphoglycerate-independent phosphoglycerate mutase [Candidatus Paceibacterota bacterium]
MKKVILVILDGWGISKETSGNAIANASTPNIDMFTNFYPGTALQASGVAVGLPWGEMGNSEVGHMILGAGKILYQNLLKVSLSIQDRSFFENKVLIETVNYAIKNNSIIHVMGLLSDGGIHSHVDHLYAILEFLKINGIKNEQVCIHIFTDGRDADPRSAIKFISDLQRNIKEENWPGNITSIMGRYYAMDRNKNWDRTKLAYYCLVNAVGNKEKNPIIALEKLYASDVTDEFIKPTLIVEEDNNFKTIKKGDAVIFFNIREDRARQLTKAFIADDFKDFDRGSKILNIKFTAMIEYEKGFDINVVFLPENVEYPLGRILSRAGIRQLRIAETEKYAHVTYFFNGGREEPFKNEFRVLIPSPSVAKYDQTPEMSAGMITDQVIKEIASDKFDFILINYANADLVGHTGNFKATINAIEFVDKCLGELYQVALDSNATLIITADHGNAEEMFNTKNGEKVTEHSINPVPFIIINNQNKLNESKEIKSFSEVGGMLVDIAPTILEIFNIQKPQEMTGKSLLDGL